MDPRISTRLLSRLVSVCEDLSLARDMDMVMTVVRRAARELTGADGATFVLLDHRSEGDYCYYADEDAIGPLWKGGRFPVHSCISGWAMMNKATVVIGDIYKDPRIPVDLYEPTFVRSLVMAPIRKKDPLGAVGTYWKDKREPTEEEVRILEALTDITAVTIELVRVYQDLEARVQERTMQLEQRNREQLANITYAERVQKAMLPSAELMNELLPDHFVIHRPKDIVSGDFHWLARREQKVLFAVADCTGHGVTGALLSAMCSHQLDRVVNEFGFTEPGLVLDMTRQLVQERLAHRAEVSDGMDISLCTIDRGTATISWSGANTPLEGAPRAHRPHHPPHGFPHPLPAAFARRYALPDDRWAGGPVRRAQGEEVHGPPPARVAAPGGYPAHGRATCGDRGRLRCLEERLRTGGRRDPGGDPPLIGS
jgi:hypothetical protein